MAARKTTKPAAKAVEEVKAESAAVSKEVKAAETPAPAKAAAVAEEKPAQKAAAAKKEPAQKAPARKAAAKKETADKEPSRKEEKASAKKAECVSTMHIQFAGKSYTQEDLVKIAKDVWTYDLNQKEEDLVSVDIYVKPEENLAYYVMNREFTGSFYI